MKKTIQELHQENLLSDTPVPVYLVHKYEKQSKSWKFDGYRCVYCASSFKHYNTVQKHKNTCKELKRVNKRSYGADDPEIVITTDRKPWKPYDFSKP